MSSKGERTLLQSLELPQFKVTTLDCNGAESMLHPAVGVERKLAELAKSYCNKASDWGKENDHLHTFSISIKPYRGATIAAASHMMPTSEVIHIGKDAVYVRLPRDMWQSCGRCDCPTCKGNEGFWDTLAIPKSVGEMTWQVHMPQPPDARGSR
jgi:hypothetical protein